jgi:glycosyltransferase involved in cell wall biosynthesis
MEEPRLAPQAPVFVDSDPSIDARRMVLMVHALGGRRGPARTMASLAAYAANEYDVVVAAPSGFLTRSLEGKDRIDVEPLPVRRSRGRSWLAGSTAIVRRVRCGRRPDVIHANGLSALSLAGIAALRYRVPVLVHFHHGSEPGVRARALARMWIALGVRVRLYPVSHSSLRALQLAGLRRRIGPILPNPLERFGEPRDQRSHEPLTIGFVGSPSPGKGLHLLVEIAVGMTDLDLTWLVFGIDPDVRSAYVRSCRDRLASVGLAERVVWGGTIEDIEEAYARMDILLVPSFHESWCRVAMEGMAAGLPVVGTAIPGLSELLGLVPGSLTFSVDHPEVAARHIRDLVDDPDLRCALGRRGREAVRPFGIDSVGPQLLSEYVRLAEGRASLVA